MTVSREILAQYLVDDIMSFEDMDNTYLSLNVHAAAKNPFSIIHYTHDKEIVHYTLFSLEQLVNTINENKNIFHLTSQTSVKSIFDMAKGKYKDSDFLIIERQFNRVTWFKKFTEAFENQLGSKIFDYLSNSRLDSFKVIMDDNFNYKIEVTFSIFSEHHPSVYVILTFDSKFVFEDVKFQDQSINVIFNKFTKEKQIKAFDFFVQYYTKENFSKEINSIIDINNDINNENIELYYELKEMFQI